MPFVLLSENNVFQTTSILYDAAPKSVGKCWSTRVPVFFLRSAALLSKQTCLSLVTRSIHSLLWVAPQKKVTRIRIWRSRRPTVDLWTSKSSVREKSPVGEVHCPRDSVVRCIVHRSVVTETANPEGEKGCRPTPTLDGPPPNAVGIRNGYSPGGHSVYLFACICLIPT